MNIAASLSILPEGTAVSGRAHSFSFTFVSFVLRGETYIEAEYTVSRRAAAIHRALKSQSSVNRTIFPARSHYLQNPGRPVLCHFLFYLTKSAAVCVPFAHLIPPTRFLRLSLGPSQLFFLPISLGF